jgi:hypothetical protein
MSKTVIKECDFPEIVNEYNSAGKTAAFDLIRSRYHIKNPYCVIKRIKGCGKYEYNSETDQFSGAGTNAADNVFMDLEELCGTVVPKKQQALEAVTGSRPASMEQLVQQLISDRLLVLSQYITIESSTRTILIDQTSLSTDGYQVITH